MGERIQKELEGIREMYQGHVSEKRRGDTARLDEVNEALGFIRDGKEVFGRLIDAKLTPFKEDADKRAAEVESNLGQRDGACQSIESEVDSLESTVEQALSDLRRRHTSLVNAVGRERAEREHQADQLTRILEGVVKRVRADQD
ncbi:hypothetical protein KIPB_010959 [Kipferlia bialata]|uniref:Uncharacterized protein n=1 Tax=Kipferlia bialata TaxID=797122 RepID=A0A9K3GNB6_9EUKA|nr:hypothetical protein KIPB_010959 [Kipferlia bialata]|eukprot:g10959.t1